MLLEVIVFAMLQHEDAVVLQQSLFEDKVRNRGNLLQRIGWVGKDEVELLVTTLKESEHVGTQGNASVVQPRDSSSSEMLPVPEKRSRAAASSKSTYCTSTLKMFSLAKSVVGRALNERGISK